MSIIRILVALAGLFWALPAVVEDILHRDDLSSVFDRYGTKGTFVFLDVTRNEMTFVGVKRATVRHYPASTFKVANSLIALETGVIADENEVIPYGGEPQFLKAWEQDMSIRDGIRISNLPVFRELARRIGPDRYAPYLEKLAYGNQDISANPDLFWLKGPLKISAVEQVAFLIRLAAQELPLSQRSQMLVRDIMQLESKGSATLFGKTGWTTAPDPDIGWFVGWVEREGRTYVFALNMDMGGREDASKRIDISKDLLAEFGVY